MHVEEEPEERTDYNFERNIESLQPLAKRREKGRKGRKERKGRAPWQLEPLAIPDFQPLPTSPSLRQNPRTSQSANTKRNK